MSAKNSTFLNTLLGVTWGAANTSPALYLFLPLNLTIDVLVNLVLGVREIAGSPARENWFSHWAFRDAYFGIRSKRQGVVSLSLNGLIPHLVGGKAGGMTTGQVVWARRKNWDWFDLPRMVEVWDIDGAPGVDAFDSSPGTVSAVALLATTGGKVRLHATSWSRGFGNSVAGDKFTDKPVAGEAFARGMIHLAEQLPEGFPTGTGTTLRVDEYITGPVPNRSVAAIETSLAFILPEGSVKQGDFLQVAAPKVIPPPLPVIAKVKDVTTDKYDGFYREIERDTVVLETELPPAFAGGKLHVRRLVGTAGTDRSGPWQGGPAELTQAEAETLGAFRDSDLLRVEASGGDVTFAKVDQIEIRLHLTPPVLEAVQSASVDLLRADAALTATLTDFTEPAKLTLTPGHPAVRKDDLLLVRLGDAKKHVAVTDVTGEVITIFPALDFPDLELHNGTLVNVQRWVPTSEKDRAAFNRVDGNTIFVNPPRAGLLSKGSMVSYLAGGKRAFREVEKMTDIRVVLASAVAGAAPFLVETARFEKLYEKGVDVVKRHRRLRFVSGANPSAYGTFPNFILGIRPRTRAAGTAPPRETMFFTNGLANADQQHHRTWKPFSEGGNDFWLLGGDLPVEVDGGDTSWRFHPETAMKFQGPVEVDVVEYVKGRASRVDGTPAGARIRVHSPEVQVPEVPSVTDTHTRAVLEHELQHTKQCADWGPLMWMLPVPGVAKLIATLRVAAGDNPPEWAQRLLDNEGLEPIEYASYGGLMQALYELFIPGELETETWQNIFNPVGGTLLRFIPDLDPGAGGGEKFGVALLQLIGHAFDFRSWTPGLGLQPWVGLDGDRNFLEQQSSRASGEMYSTTLSADDKFNADYKTYFIPHKLRDADGGRSLASVTRMMTWASYTTNTLLSLQHGNRPGSPLEHNDIGRGVVSEILSFTADTDVVIPNDLYDATGPALTIEGPASLTRANADFRVVTAGNRITPRLRSLVPTPPRVNRSTGYYFVPAAPASYTLTANGPDSAPSTNVVKLNVTEGNVTLGNAAVPWARPAAVGAPLGTLPVLRMPEGVSRRLSTNGPITGWTADLDSSAQFTLSTEAQGWRIAAPAAFAPNVSVRVRLYRVLDPNDAAFDLTYDGTQVPSLQGVRSLLGTPVFIPARDFVIELVRAMKGEVVLNGNPAPTANYIGWTPRPATIRLTEAGGETAPVAVTLRNAPGNVGQVVFAATANGTPADTLLLNVPVDGTTASFFVRGKFGSPSRSDKDCVIEAVNPDGDVVSRTALMVRVRKNAATLTPAERDRFVSAMAVFNDAGLGRFSEIRNMHLTAALNEAHGAGDPDFQDGFLSWHRAYLLDLERALQAIDASVSIPYWKFDAPAPSIFTADFLGEPGGGGSVRFSATNPLQNWTTDGELGFRRTPRFSFATEPAGNVNGPVITEEATLDLGRDFAAFVLMERNPHGRAHSSFDGPLNDPATAPRDPIFFLLHANVDRLWAKWQKNNNRFDPAVPGTYSFLGRAGDAGATRIGHNLLDTMWPWNGNTTSPRPSTAPGGGLPASTVVSAPPAAPTVGDMIDCQGRLNATRWQGFDYDDVDF
jgi:tyrosinase